MKENIGVSGTWLFVWRDKDGNILETREEHNLITQSGLEAIAALFLGESYQPVMQFTLPWVPERHWRSKATKN